jgi:hypothetical protein
MQSRLSTFSGIPATYTSAQPANKPRLSRSEAQQLDGPSGFDFLGLGLRATCFDGDLHSIFHRIFEGHLDSK